MRYRVGDWYVGSGGIPFAPHEAPRRELVIRAHRPDCPRATDATIARVEGTTCPGCVDHHGYVGLVRLTDGQTVLSTWSDDARPLGRLESLRARVLRAWNRRA